ncbi:MAG: glycosyltransferase [Flavobacteriaceae bacterium]|nr:glycosyltransferase [Flavobacteriaceae bacterium]
MIVIALLITTLYCFIIGLFIIGFGRVKKFEASEEPSDRRFSILIAFRNEEHSLTGLLDSLKSLEYPQDQFEVIFIDDASDDDSVKVIQNILDDNQNDIKIINNIRKSDAPKKDAINTGIQEARFDWIITTDADCIVPKYWLKMFDSFLQKNDPELIVGPVIYGTSLSFLDCFQLLDILSLQGATIGGFGIKKPFLCNGANLCYSKAIFTAVNGFKGNENVASGDDIFLLEKVQKKYPDKVLYLKSKDAIVTTKPVTTFKELLQQRIRWAAKSTRYKNRFSKLVALSVFGMNALLILLFILSVLAYFNWLYIVFFFLIKFLIDAILLFKTASFFNQKRVLLQYIASSFIYPFFSMFVAIASLNSSYQWKGRQFKK